MTYEEAYMNCKNREEFCKMVLNDLAYAIIFNRDRLGTIEDAVNKVCQVHPDWSDKEETDETD